jgi:hypothetical protein
MQQRQEALPAEAVNQAWRALDEARLIEAAKAYLRHKGEPLTRAAVRAIAWEMRREHEAMSRDIDAGRIPENEPLSAGNRKARRAAYAKARRAGA